jgi:hypothetical protein
MITRITLCESAALVSRMSNHLTQMLSKVYTKCMLLASSERRTSCTTNEKYRLFFITSAHPVKHTCVSVPKSLMHVVRFHAARPPACWNLDERSTTSSMLLITATRRRVAVINIYDTQVHARGHGGLFLYPESTFQQTYN